MLRRARGFVLLIVLSIISITGLLTGCTGAPSPAARPTATLIPTLAPPTATAPPPLQLIDAELLGAPGVQSTCDHPPEAQMTCHDTAAQPILDVEISAATYARWSLQWDIAATPLTGDETLALDLARTGNLMPNLYLVERGGNRVGVSLARFWPTAEATGTGETLQVHVPLREVRTPEGAPPDYAAVNALQLVFEWADMAGSLAVHSIRFASVWSQAAPIDAASQARAAGLQMPPGFVAQPLAQDLAQMTQIEFTPRGDMLVSLQDGRIWWYVDQDGDGQYDTRRLYATGSPEVVGLLFDPADGAVWVGGRGQLVRTLDGDGNGAADHFETRISGLRWGRHQNNGLAWNPDPDPFSGEPGGHWLYFGLGSVDDLAVGDPLNAAVLRFPRDGQSAADLEVVSQGNRNAYDLVWANLPVDPEQPDGARTWQLFASENGPDFNDAPDEVNHIRWGKHYGFPDQFGPVADPSAEGAPYSGPVYPVTPHASADGMAYIDHPAWPAEYRTLYVTLFGEVFSPAPVGHTVERIRLHAVTLPDGTHTYRGEPSDFITGLERPLPLATGPDGQMIVGDYATGVVYKIVYSPD